MPRAHITALMRVPVYQGVHNAISYVVKLPAGGQDWGGPHLLVGRLLLGHTIRLERGGWGSTGHYQDNACEHVSRFVGSDPLPRLLGHVGEVFEGLPSDISFQAAHDLWSG